MQNSRSSPRALTLVELLLVIALMSAIIAGIGGLVQSTGQLQQRFNQDVSVSLRYEATLEELSRDLEAAQVFFGIPFLGEPQMIQFARVAMGRDEQEQAQLEWHRVVYRLEADGDDQRFVREAFRFQDDGGSPGETREVLAPVQNVQMAFGWRNPETDTVEWISPWPEFDEWVIPQLMRVQLTVAGLEGQPPVVLERIVRNPTGFVPESLP